MAASTTTSLRLKFNTGDPDTDLSLSFAGVDKSKCDKSTVKSVMDSIVTYGSVYEDIPTSRKSAEVVETTTTPIDV